MTRQDAIHTLKDMEMDFDSWFNWDGSETEEEKQMYRDGFSRAKLCIELGEYDIGAYDYLDGLLDVLEAYRDKTGQGRYYDAILRIYGEMSVLHGWV